jgi:ribonuclease-3
MYTKILRRLRSRKSAPVNLPRVEKILGYRFSHPELLVQALTHQSYLAGSENSACCSNERLEFLGDAVLELIVTQFLYHKYPDTREGDLSKSKSILVSRRVLARIVSALDLGQFLLMNRGEEQTGGRTRASNLANLYESVLGAIYLDGGLKPARRFIETTMLGISDRIISDERNINYKSVLLEYAQAKKIGAPHYRMIEDQGPDHEKTFTIEVNLGSGHAATGSGRSKKLAEQEAAQELIRRIAPHLLENNASDSR